MIKAAHGFGADFAANFPDSSKSGDTHASPEIWANKTDFTKRAMAYEADATAASPDLVAAVFRRLRAAPTARTA